MAERKEKEKRERKKKKRAVFHPTLSPPSPPPFLTRKGKEKRGESPTSPPAHLPLAPRLQEKEKKEGRGKEKKKGLSSFTCLGRLRHGDPWRKGEKRGKGGKKSYLNVPTF